MVEVEDYPRLTPSTIVKTLNDNPEIYLSEGPFYEEVPVHFGGRSHDIQLSPVGLLYTSMWGVKEAKNRAHLRDSVLFTFIGRRMETPTDYLHGLEDGFVGASPPISHLGLTYYQTGYNDGTVARSLIEGEQKEAV